MDALLWKRIGDLFDAARELDGPHRVQFLKEQCGDDEALLKQVQSLLDADDGRGPLYTAPTVSVLTVPQIVAGRFRIVRYIADGGMGTVYEAEDLKLNDRVALKTIRADIASNPRVVERFKREIVLAKKVTHPNVCRIHDLGVDRSETGQEFLFLTMQFLNGETLASRIKRGPIPQTEALPLIEDMADALSAAHQAEVIHRDFKSGNVMLVHGGDRTCAVVTDFGLARGTHDDRSLQAGLVGTVDYMAPEQIKEGEVTSASDIYALGVVMYEMVTGQRPFTGETNVAVLTKHLHDEPRRPRDLVASLDPNWNEAILHCLRKPAYERFQSADEIKAVLRQPSQWHKYPLAALQSKIRSYGRWRVMALVGVLIALALVAILLVNFYRQRLEPITSVAVLPIVNRTGSAETNYLSGGITTALTNDLSQVSGLSVTAESIAAAQAKKTSDLRSLGRDLGVQAIVTGSLATTGPRLLLQIELFDANTGSLIWGQTYDRNQTELGATQEDVAREVAYRLRIRLETDVSERLQRQYRTNSEAYDAYLKGRYALRDRSPDGFESALAYFQQAIDRDPQYALAFAGLADTYCLMAYNRIQPTIALLDKCKAAANRALHFDSTLAEAYSSLASAITLADFNWTAAEEVYRRSIQLNPNYPPAHLWYGLTLLAPLGRYAEARAQLDYARRMEPEALMTHVSIALTEYYAGEYDASINELQEIKKRSPSFAAADEILATDYLAKNMPAEAIQIILQSPPSSEEKRQVMTIMLGIAYARSGRTHLALKQLSEAEKALGHGFQPNLNIAELCAAVGNRQKAMDYLEKAFSSRQTSILFVNVDPLIDPVRSDERFHQLLSRLNLP